MNFFIKVFILTLIWAQTAIVAAQTAADSQKALHIEPTSLRPVQTDALTGVNIDPIQTDMSNRPCARIKTRMNRMTKAEISDVEIKIIGGNAQVIRRMVADDGNGLIFEVTARDNLRFYFQHPEFGESNDVQLAVEGNKEYYLDAWLNQLYTIIIASNTADAEVYINDTFKGRTDANFVLSVKEVLPGEHTLRVVYGGQSHEQKINVNSGSTLYFKQNVNLMAGAPQYVVFQLKPSNAAVIIDDKPYTPSNGIVSALLASGSHNYRISAAGYHDEFGTVTISGAKVEKSVELKPAFGWLEMQGEQYNGALVYVDNNYIATAPFSRKAIASGSHNVKIIKELYKPYNATIDIKEGSTFTLSPQLIADFATIDLSVEERAEIWIDGKRVGTGSWSGNLQSGEHIAEARLANHKTTVQTLQIAANTPQTIKLETPKPIYGTLDITSTPAMADISFDGKVIGRTPMLYSEALVGRHLLRITKAGYADYSANIEIVEGKVTAVTAMLPSGGAAMGDIANTTSTTPNQGSGGTHEPIEMVLVKGGTFVLDEHEEGNPIERQNVTLSDFYIGKYEVTQAQWLAIMERSVSQQRDAADKSYQLYGEGDRYPIYYVSFEEAKEFCRRLSRLTGRRYRLPTEAEWEYAAEGGIKSQSYRYSGSNRAKTAGWFRENSKKLAHTIGELQPNELGIFDMSGNIAEICLKSRATSPTNMRTNPNSATTTESPTIKGGSWATPAKLGIIETYNYDEPLLPSHLCGFRVVMEIPAAR